MVRRTPEQRSEGEGSPEPEPNSFKTGLELIEMAVGENPTQWIEIGLREDSLFRTLVMKGKNGVFGAFYLKPISYPGGKGSFLETFQAIRTGIEDQVEDPSDFASVAQKSGELGEEVGLLVLTEAKDGSFYSAHPDFYEISAVNRDDLMKRFKEHDEHVSQGVLAWGEYRLSTKLLSFEFPRLHSNQDFSYGILVRRKKPWGSDVEIGEAMPWIETQLEASRELEQFLVKNWSHFEALFKNWQS